MTAGVMVALLCLAAGPQDEAAADLADVIDRRLEERAREAQIPLAPRADDAEFFRRLTIDLRGHIPAADDVQRFLEDEAPDKRSRAIRSALEHSDHRRHFATTWRRLLLPEAESRPQIQYFLPGFEAWLEKARFEDRGFDAMVRELVAAPIHGTPDHPQMVLTDLSAPNPIAYLATKEADPAKLAAGVTRLFMGVRLECAQCHDHPFDQWTREQFWQQAAFFAGISRRGKGTFAPVVEDRGMRTIGVMDSPDTAEAVFLTSVRPDIPEGISPRKAYADWMTSRDNPFFAKAIVNRVWAQLMGVGLVDPVDDFHQSNPPSHPELLDEMAQAFQASGYQLDLLYLAICASDAYQRTSRQTDAAQSDARMFARMAVKPMTAEQLHDSLQRALGGPGSEAASPRSRGDKRRFLDLFATPEGSGEPVTSMPQALFLMNSESLERQVQRCATHHAKGGDDDDVIRAIFLSTLSRLPSDGELEQSASHLGAAAAAERSERIADVIWAVLNLPEFRWNH